MKFTPLHRWFQVSICKEGHFHRK